MRMRDARPSLNRTGGRSDIGRTAFERPVQKKPFPIWSDCVIAIDLHVPI